MIVNVKSLSSWVWVRLPYRLPVGTRVAAGGFYVLLALAICLVGMGADPEDVTAASAASVAGGVLLLCYIGALVQALMGAAVGRPYAVTLWRTRVCRAIAAILSRIGLVASCPTVRVAHLPAKRPLRRLARTRIPTHLALGWTASVHPLVT